MRLKQPKMGSRGSDISPAASHGSDQAREEAWTMAAAQKIGPKSRLTVWTPMMRRTKSAVLQAPSQKASLANKIYSNRFSKKQS